MRRRTRPALVIALIFLLAAGAAILYMKALEHLISARMLLVDEIECATGKKVFFQSVRFTLLKGLVLDRLVVYDDKAVIIRAREVSCGLVLPSVVSNRIIIPVIRIDSPDIYSERREDNTLSLLDLIPKEYRPKCGAALSIHKIVIRGGSVNFVDRTLKPAFTNRAKDLNAEARLYLPIRVTFRSDFYITSASGQIAASGEYIIPRRELVCNIAAEKLIPKAFLPYYQGAGISFPSGSVSGSGVIRWRDDAIDASLEAVTKDLFAAKGALRARLDSVVNMLARYDSKEKRLGYRGKADLRAMDIYGIQGPGRIENIKAKVEFDDAHLWSENVRLDVYGIPWEAKVNIANYRRPVLDIYLHTATRLSLLQKILKENFKAVLPVEISGKGDLRLALQMEPDKPAKFNGYLSVADMTVGLGSGNFPIERAGGEIRFDMKEAKWPALGCFYRGTAYKTAGTLTDFASPRLQLTVSSKDLSYAADLTIKKKIITISKASGRLFNSAFSADGEIGLEDSASVDADIKGAFTLDLNDLKKMAQNSAGTRKMRAAGKVRADFKLTGDIKNLRACYVDAKLKSKAMSVYGLKFSDMSLEYLQEQGVAKIKNMRSSFYGGTLSASAGIDWLSKGLPWALTADSIGVKLERLKEDTGFKDKDVSGELRVYADLKGVFKDASRSSGIGHASIKKTRLWQLDLFKGAGALIFSSDFSEIVFTEGACDFKIKDKAFRIENLVMKSDQLDLYGYGRIGMDRSVEGTLRPEIKEGAVSEGTAGKMAIAIGKGTVIDIGGTLAEPAYKRRTNVVDVVGAMLQSK